MFDLRARQFWRNKPKASNAIASQDLSILKQGHDADTGATKAGSLEFMRNGFVSQRFQLYIIFQILNSNLNLTKYTQISCASSGKNTERM